MKITTYRYLEHRIIETLGKIEDCFQNETEYTKEAIERLAELSPKIDAFMKNENSKNGSFVLNELCKILDDLRR